MPDETPRENAHEDGGETTASAPEVAVPDDEVAAGLLERFEGALFNESHGQPVVYLPRQHWHDAAQFLRDEESFTMCLDVTVVDHLLDGVRYCAEGVEPERYEVVSNFISHARNRRIRLISEVPASDPAIASISDLYPGMNFGEREAYDMFGVTFEGHPDLTRILMP